jgi:viologen exporter family transport system permease protein
VRGPNQLGWLTAQFFAGVFVPVVFFPAWLGAVASATPFPSMAQLSGEVFLGKHPGIDLVAVYGMQLFWALALFGLGRVLLRAAMRKVVVQGG